MTENTDVDLQQPSKETIRRSMETSRWRMVEKWLEGIAARLDKQDKRQEKTNELLENILDELRRRHYE